MCHTQRLHSEPHKANPWNVSSCGWWNIHGGRGEKKLTKTVCGSGRKITVLATLNKSRLNCRNYHSVDRGNLFINFTMRNAFLMAPEMMFAEGGKQSHSSVLSFWQTVCRPILSYVTPATKKKCWAISLFSELLGVVSEKEEIYKDIIWIQTKIVRKKKPCRSAEKSVAFQPLWVKVLIVATQHLNLGA